VAEPSLDIGDVETVLDAPLSSCYSLSSHRNRLALALAPNA
jgi:hypothetical protein